MNMFYYNKYYLNEPRFSKSISGSNDTVFEILLLLFSDTIENSLSYIVTSEITDSQSMLSSITILELDETLYKLLFCITEFSLDRISISLLFSCTLPK